MVKIYDKLPPRNSPWLSFYQPSTKVNSNPRMFRYCRKLSINHCSSDQSERNKSCIPDPATICTLLNEYVHKRLLKTSLFVNMIFLSHHKRPRVILPQEIVKKFFAHSRKKQRSKIKPKEKIEKKKDMTSMAIIQKGRILIFFYLERVLSFCLIDLILNSIWGWSNNVPQ